MHSEFNDFVKLVVFRRTGSPSRNDFDDKSGFEEVCAAAYGVDFAALKYLLWEVGISASVSNPSKLTPLHCLASLYTMAEATSKSHVFSMLKGVESWLSPIIGDRLPLSSGSVRSMDMIEVLGPRSLQVRCDIQPTPHLTKPFLRLPSGWSRLAQT